MFSVGFRGRNNVPPRPPAGGEAAGRDEGKVVSTVCSCSHPKLGHVKLNAVRWNTYDQPAASDSHTRLVVLAGGGEVRRVSGGGVGTNINGSPRVAYFRGRH